MVQKYHNFFLWRGNLEKGLPKNRPDNLEDNDVETQPHLSVVWPTWPVGLNDMRNTAKLSQNTTSHLLMLRRISQRSVRCPA